MTLEGVTDEEQVLMANIAEANGFQLFKKYDETEAAVFLDLHPQSLKKLRLQGKITHLRLEARKIAYFGLHLADYMIGSVTWANQPSMISASANTGSRSALTEKAGSELGMTQTAKTLDARASLAAKALKKPDKP